MKATSSDSQVCHRRHLQVGDGRLVQCLGCGSIGIEFGTTYLVFSETEFFTFARWLSAVSWESAHIERGRMHIRLREENSMMLSLAREELRTVQALIDEGVRWVASAGLINDVSAKTHVPMGDTVH